MTRVTVPLADRSYDITIGTGILPGIGQAMALCRFSPPVGVLSNPTVYSLYGGPVIESLKKAGFDPFPVLIPDGEAYKDYFWAHHALTELLRRRLDRNSCVVALGGGVIGDMAGFVASLYMRGIHFVQVPTTLLAQVDSSVGGKTGVNHPLGKNMIGTFHQPRLVWIDTETLRTLPLREVRAGIAEVIKYGVIWDGEFLQFLHSGSDAVAGLDGGALARVITRSCEIKAAVVSEDEREAGLRAILNFGHTIGHAVETETGYTRFLHGEAVAVGMCLEARLSTSLGLMDRAEADLVRDVVASYRLPSALPGDLSPERLIGHMMLDKKALAGQLRFALPERIGKVKIVGGIGREEIEKALAS